MLSDEKRRFIVNEIISFFKEERSEEIGVIAAEVILDFFLEVLGKELYNKGLFDSKEFIRKSFENIDVDLDAMIKR